MALFSGCSHAWFFRERTINSRLAVARAATISPSCAEACAWTGAYRRPQYGHSPCCRLTFKAKIF
jgi:hypothetical protein